MSRGLGGHHEGRRHRRYRTEFKLQLVEAYRAGDGSANGLADEHGSCHSRLRLWAEPYRTGELTLDVQREEQLPESQLAARPRHWSVVPTDSAHDEPVFPDLRRELRPSGHNQVWVADLTYLRLEHECAYLAVVLDAWSRPVVGYAVSHVLDARLPLAALEAALEGRGDEDVPLCACPRSSDHGYATAAGVCRPCCSDRSP